MKEDWLEVASTVSHDLCPRFGAITVKISNVLNHRESNQGVEAGRDLRNHLVQPPEARRSEIVIQVKQLFRGKAQTSPSAVPIARSYLCMRWATCWQRGS